METEMPFDIERTTSTECRNRALVDAARAVQALPQAQRPKARRLEVEDRSRGADRRNSNP